MTTATAQPAAVKELPIIFGAPMVRAILDGRKTQTRRVVKLPMQWSFPPAMYDERSGRLGRFGLCSPDESIPCPYGKPGERLWVREKWHPHGVRGHERAFPVTYAADREDSWRPPMGRPWHSSIHMPRWASRITLEVTGVRVERLRDISNEDAAAEGVSTNPDDYHISMDGKPATCEFISPSYAFACLWNRIHGDGAFGKNPWVWVIEFKRLTLTPTGRGRAE